MKKDVEAALREIRIALLEADVNFKVVKSLISAVKERSVGHEVLKSLSPAQQVIKIVREELTALLEQDNSQIKMASTPPTIILLAGIQGGRAKQQPRSNLPFIFVAKDNVRFWLQRIYNVRERLIK